MNSTSHSVFENAFKDTLRPQVDAVIAALNTESGSQGLKSGVFCILTAEPSVQIVDESAG